MILRVIICVSLCLCINAYLCHRKWRRMSPINAQWGDIKKKVHRAITSQILHCTLDTDDLFEILDASSTWLFDLIMYMYEIWKDDIWKNYEIMRNSSRSHSQWGNDCSLWYKESSRKMKKTTEEIPKKSENEARDELNVNKWWTRGRKSIKC